MPLKPGVKLGPYEITGSLGAGGMGEVYKARDTRLDRSVAIKVLPRELTGDPTLRQRLEREARAVSSLEHPHICTLYDVGADGDCDFLVMQLLEGQTLAERLTAGPLRLPEALAIGAQLADALAAAHKRGIVHRDLKPGNVMLTPPGPGGAPHAKLLDFGLAKQIEAPFAAAAGATRTMPLTAERSVVGTLNYMSPEQLEARDADARSDIFALGVVIYEMVTGHRAFDGSSSASIVAAIMTSEPRPIADVVPLAPRSLDVSVRRCLEKNPDDRWQAAADLAWELRQVASSPRESVAAPGERPRRVLPAAVGAVILAALAAAAGYWWSSRTRGLPPQEIRLSLLPPDGHTLDAEYDPEFAVSPDGRQVAFVAADGQGRRQLWIRHLDESQAHVIPDTERATRPFWSPDSRYLAYASPEGLLKVPIAGGAPQLITPLSGSGFLAHGTWGGGVIMFDRAVSSSPTFASRVGVLLTVPEGGGPATPVPHGTAPADAGQRYPAMLPDGRHYLFLSWASTPADRAVYLGTLGSDERTRLVSSGFKAFYANGFLYFVRDRRLVAQRLSLDPPKLMGDPIPVIEGLALEGIPGQATVSVSASGVVAYRSRDADLASEVHWMGRSGQPGPPLFTPATDITMSLSADGTRALVTRLITSANADERVPANIWLLDLLRGVATRTTLDPGVTDENPVWSPDGSQFAYASHRRGGLADLRIQLTTDPGSSRVLASGTDNLHPIDWSRDGQYLLLQRYATVVGAGDDVDLWVLPMRSGGTPESYITESHVQAQGQFSPDGRWVAYASDESGRAEVYVRPFPLAPGRWQLSSSGGGQPRWRGDGRELYYVGLDGTVMAVPIEVRGAEVVPGSAVRLFTEPPLRLNNSPFLYGGMANYDVAHDGARLIVNRLTREPGLGPLQIVINAVKP